MRPLVVGVVKESAAGERRVALVPDQVHTLTAVGLRVAVESGAGAAAWFDDGAYLQAGAEVLAAGDLDAAADVVVGIGPPPAGRLHSGQTVLGLLDPLADPAYIQTLAAQGVTAVSLDGLPRTLSRAQAMDALTSQANVAGYKAALLAANLFAGYFPMLVTAAGTHRPARVLVLGAGVAGLQAIGTARRLGAVVAGYDIRPESRSEVESVGGTFLTLDGPADGHGDGGYARALAAGEQERQQAALAEHIARYDVVITTARVPGRRPPLLVSEEALKGMAPGSVIIDMAAGARGGNAALSVPGQTVTTENHVTIVGADNLAATVPAAASAAYSRNVTALLRHLIRDGALAIDLTDEIQAGVVVAYGATVVHPSVARLLDLEGGPR
jgi:NAD(P) transhydrogenase subunit alpha